ncbi:hypothetical protein [Marinimicrobium locisalis]|uniref:hypothetical protein n=1 Tax=Marinimicrobium locisalis TaxID=546022 RepID=UPI003D2FCDC8
MDITIAGSSGIGTIKEGQKLSEVVSRFSPIIEQLGFKAVQFFSTGQFPGTGIVYLVPERVAFDELHSAISGSGVSFNANRWPYNPHCTLAAVSNPVGDLGFADSLEIPEATEIKCFSLYLPELGGGTRIHQF